MDQPTKISGHRQITPSSCIPMSIECVLKELGLMQESDFQLQNDPTKSGTSDWVVNFSYPFSDPKVVFSREYLLSDKNLSDRGPHFMQDHFDSLFNTIDSELDAGRYVIISLESGPNQWHMEVIYHKISCNEYKTVSFYHGDNEPKYWEQKLRDRVSAMQGTDILTYKFL